MLLMAQLSGQRSKRWEDQDNVTTNEALDRQFGPTGAESEQIHVALLTDGESFDVVLGAAPSGLDALRRRFVVGIL